MSLLRIVGSLAVGGRAFLVLPVVAFLAFTPGVARAQALPGVTGIVPPVLRLEPNGANADATGETPHTAGVADNVINYADCVADLSFQFTLQLSRTSADHLVAWVGPNDCTALASREGPNATCWPLSASPLPQGNTADDAGATTTTIAVRVQDIVSQAATAAGSVSTTYKPGGWHDQTDGVCTRQTNDAQVPLYIWMFFTDFDNLGEGGVGGGDAIGVSQPYPVVVDTYAQDLAGDVGISQSLDSQLTVTISAPNDSDTVSYNIYCDPPPAAKQPPYDASVLVEVDDAAPTTQCVADAASGRDAAPEDATANDAADSEASDASVDSPSESPDGGSADASDDDAADSGAGASPPDDAGGNSCGIPVNDAAVYKVEQLACPPSYLVSGAGTSSLGTPEDGGADDGATVSDDAGASVRGTMLLDIPQKYACGTASPSSPVVAISGLTDGYTYTIAVAAVDVSGNVGPLSVGIHTVTTDAGTTVGNLCAQVSEIPDFWATYLEAGGQAGGGYCATEGVGIPAGTTGLGLLMIASTIAIVRTRRRRPR